MKGLKIYHAPQFFMHFFLKGKNKKGMGKTRLACRTSFNYIQGTLAQHKNATGCTTSKINAFSGQHKYPCLLLVTRQCKQQALRFIKACTIQLPYPQHKMKCE